MKCRNFLCFLVIASILSLPFSRAFSQGEKNSSTNAQGRPALVKAVMCEAIRDNAPYFQGMVFPVGAGKVLCYSEFDPVPQKTVIYHNWYHRDQPSTKLRLGLQPPRWSTYSSIQLREDDKGPWRVEITDQNGQILSTLRFSVTD